MYINLVGGFNNLDKYESQLGSLFPIWWEKSSKCSEPPTKFTNIWLINLIIHQKNSNLLYIYIFFLVYNIISHQVLASPWLRHAPRRQRQDAVHQIPGSSDLETNHHGRGQGIPGGRIPESQREPLAIGVVSQFLDKPSIYWA